MKNVVSAIFVACAMSVAVGVSAQGQPGAQGTEPRTQPPSASTPSPTEQRAGSQRQAQQKVTISGCIQNAPAAEVSTSASASKYVLGNAKMASGAAANATVGTTGTAAATRYRLEGDDKTISPHLNHQVEITGMVQNSSASATSAATAAPGSAAAGPILKVDSLKMVSTTCQ